MQVNNIKVSNNQFVKSTQKNTSFKGIGTVLGNANKFAMQHLENGGFFLEFCLMDLLGLVLPRVYQGFKRNKDELGHLNYQAGFEELIREGVTGPSMFLIPIGAVTLAGKSLGKATQVNFNFLEKFEECFKSIGEKFATSNNDATRKAFANSIFDKLFVENPNKINHPADATVKPLEAFREKFVKFLTDNIPDATESSNNKSFIERFKANKAMKKQIANLKGQFVDLVSDINIAHFNRENSIEVFREGSKKALSASDLFLDARKYMEDVIPSAKLTFDELISKGTNITKELFNSTISKITSIRHNGRELLCLGGTAALAGFLCIVPKLYQLSNKNPALSGFEKNKNNKEASKC